MSYLKNLAVAFLAICQILPNAGLFSTKVIKAASLGELPDTIPMASQGIGTKDDPFIIFNMQQYKNMNNDRQAHYKLGADIDFAGESYEIIGTQAQPFKGSFDGSGYEIRNVEIETENNYVGLFGYTDTAEIKNIKLVDSQIKGGSSVGSLIGQSKNSRIEASSAENVEVAGAQSSVGGLVGFLSNGSTIERSYASAQVSGNQSVGGLVGSMTEDATLINQSYSTGAVENKDTFVGGLVGHIVDGNIKDSFSLSDVSSNYVYTGGLVGLVSYDTVEIINCYAAGKVSANGKGLVGHGEPKIISSYFDTISTGIVNTDAYNVGKTTSAMVRKAIYADWDFENIWGIEEGKTYPYIQALGRTGEIEDTTGLEEGSGTKDDPTIIKTVAQYKNMNNDRQAHYKLGADIDFAGESYEIIGTQAQPFKGSFDGSGYEIRNVEIETENNYVGLFGYTDTAEIKNIKLVDSQIKGGSSVGSLIGQSKNSRIEASSAENVEVAGAQSSVGGLVGFLSNGSTIERSYASAQVSGNQSVGGLVGSMTEDATLINQSYSTGAVENKDTFVGGLVGHIVDGNIKDSFSLSDVSSNYVYTGGLVGLVSYDTVEIINCYAAGKVSANGKGLVGHGEPKIISSYFDTISTGIVNTDAYNVGKTTLEMTRREFYTGWDFESIWGIEEGKTYPYIQALGRTGEIEDTTGLEEGSGTKDDPTIIKTVAQYKNMNNDRQAHYKLGADIDFEGESYEVIGTSMSIAFQGSLDGNGYEIRNVEIETENNYTGLFGYTDGAAIKNVKLVDSRIKGSSHVGGLIGYGTNSKIENSSVENVEVTGTMEHIGGLAGYLGRNSTIERSYASAKVSGRQYVGGLVGTIADATTVISQSYSKGEVKSSNNSVGGLAGQMSNGVIKDSFSLSHVTGNTTYVGVGGLVGNAANTSQITNCYVAGKVSANGKGLIGQGYPKVTSSYFDATVSGLLGTDAYNVGKITSAMTRKGIYTDWDFENVWEIDEGKTYPYIQAIGKAGEIEDTTGLEEESGTKDDPTIIKTVAQYKNMNNDRQAHYKLGADIDFEGESYEVIGTSMSIAFQGSLDGNGYEIRNVEIETENNYTGLFGYTDGAAIKNVKLVDSRIKGSSHVGGLIGYGTNSKIENSSVENVEVTGTMEHIGGLAGYLGRNSTIERSYASAKVSGRQYVGGLVGTIADATTVISQSYSKGEVKSSNNSVGGLAGQMSNGVIKDSFSLSHVTGNTTYVGVGGLVGNAANTSQITNCYVAGKVSANGKGLIGQGYPKVTSSYFDATVSGLLGTDAYNVGKITSAMTRKGIYTDWDFENVWEIDEGKTYPYIQAIGKAGEIEDTTGLEEGSGTKDDPTIIKTVAQYKNMNNDRQAHYKLGADIDFEGESYEVIGTSMSIAFQGSLDGNGYEIRNVEIETENNYTGLFGYTDGAAIKNVKLVDSRIKGSSHVGGLIGYGTNSKIENSSVENVEVTGTMEHIGGLAGYLGRNSTIERSYASAKVSGRQYVGGLVGTIADTTTVISQSYSKGEVKSSNNSVGGLAGQMSNGVIKDSFSLSHVTGNTTYVGVGGLVGNAANTSQITNCYVAGKVSANGKGLIGQGYPKVTSSYFDATVSGLLGTDAYNVGKITSAMTRKGIYTDWDFENVWEIDEGKTYPYIQALGRTGEIEDTTGLEEGSGTKDDPTIIKTVAQYKNMNNDRQAHYKLGADIDFEGESYEVIGTSMSIAFQGSLDGNGYEIRNVEIETENNYTGLFGYTDGAAIKNVKLVDSRIKGSSHVGGLIGYGTNSKIENSSVENVEVTGTMEHIGGLAGYLGRNSTIERSYASAKVSGRQYVGGLVGTIADATTVISQSYSKGEVKSSNNSVGGLAGQMSNGVIKDSFSLSDLTGDFAHTGGLVGNATNTSEITNSFAAGKVGAKGKGLVGAGMPKVTSSYFDATVSGITTPEDQARTTEQLYFRETYQDWDFINIWGFEENNYPKLINIIDTSISRPSNLKYRELTDETVVIEWAVVNEATEYEVSYGEYSIVTSETRILIQKLAPATEYSFKVRAKVGGFVGPWSNSLNIKTLRTASQLVEGLHFTTMTPNSITLEWDAIMDAVGYEVLHDNYIKTVDGPQCAISGLSENKSYVFRVRPIFENYFGMLSIPYVVKVTNLGGKTEYALDFIAKCEGQDWFISEIEHILSLQGKSINELRSKEDLSRIYALGLEGRNISGKLPRAIGELYNLEYIYLANNNLEGSIPDEMANLISLKVLDLSSNNLSGQIDSVVHLKDLKVLLLHRNQFEGNIPEKIVDLNKLINLDLNLNSFTGQAPDFSGMKELKYLSIPEVLITE